MGWKVIEPTFVSNNRVNRRKTIAPVSNDTLYYGKDNAGISPLENKDNYPMLSLQEYIQDAAELINLQPTSLDSVADVVIHAKAGMVLPQIVAALA